MSDKKIIVVSNQKGGVGKTTICQNLAGALAGLEKNILLVDLDPQGNLSKSFLDEIIEGRDCTVLDIFNNGDFIQPLKTYNPKIKILPATKSLSSIVPQMVTDYDFVYRLQEFLTLKPVKENFDLIVIDTPPTLMNLTLSGMVAADFLLIPISTSFFSLQGTNDLFESFQKVKTRLNANLEFLGICVSKYDKRTALANDVLEQVKSQFKEKLFETIIPGTVKIEEAQVKQKTVRDLFPNSEIALLYSELAREILGRIL